MLYASSDGANDATAIGAGAAVQPEHLPSVANGFLGFQVDAEHLFVSGLFAGAALAPSRRARVPAALAALRLAGAPRLHCAFDVRQAVYSRRSYVVPPPGDRRLGPLHACSAAGAAGQAAAFESSCTEQASRVWVEQRWYAHRVLRHVLVHEVAVLGEDGEAANHARPLDDHLPGDRHEPGHTSHGHFRPASRRETLDVVLDVLARERDRERGTGDGGSAGSDAGLRGVTVRLGPLRSYVAPGWVQRLGDVRITATPLAVLKFSLRGDGAAAGIASGRSDEIDLQDVTQAACDMGAASADAVVRAALRGCGFEWTAQAGYVRDMELPSLEHTPIVVLTSRLPPFGALPIYEAGVTVPLLTVVCTGLEMAAGATIQEVVVGAARQYELAVALAGQRVLFALHATAWRDGVWRSGIEVEAAGGAGEGSRLGAVVNASLHSILSLARADWPFGMSPGGLSTNGYNGHHFWDAESFSFPPLNLMWPHLASSMLLYRFHRLPGARVKARAYAGAGLRADSSLWLSAAAFPWESAATGVETCPPYAPTGEGEIHVSGDVAVAVWQHFQATGDAVWLRNIGFPILSGVADFFLSRALADSPGAVVAGANGRNYFSGRPPHRADASLVHGLPVTEWPLHIAGVIAATEFYQNVTDNALTNGVARLALRYAARAARVLGLERADFAHWDDAASRIVFAAESVAGGGALGGVRPYFAGYSSGRPVQLLDVAMLHDMLVLDNGDPVAGGAGDGGSVAARRSAAAAAAAADVRYYLSVFEGGAAFAYALNAIAAARIGELATAHSYFAKAHTGFVHGPFCVWTEYGGGSGCPNFVTGAAAFLDALIAGFAGVRLEDSGLSVRPTALPAGATRLRLRALSLQGLRFSVEFDSAQVTVTREDDAGGAADSLDAALLRTARRLAAEHAANAARASKGWLWETEQHAAFAAAERLFSDERANSNLEDGEAHDGSGGDVDLADPGASIDDMLRARPWLDVTAHQSRSSAERRARAAAASTLVLSVEPERGERVALRLPGEAASFPLGQTLLVYVAEEVDLV